jgi:hypothetical protein
MTAATRYGQPAFGGMTIGQGRRGTHNINIRHKSTVPLWYLCPADEFIYQWLPKFETGQLPKPKVGEMRHYETLLRSPDAEKEEDEDADEIDAVSSLEG